MPPPTVDDYIYEIREYLQMIKMSKTISTESRTQIEKVNTALDPFEEKMNTLENKIDISNEVEDMYLLLEDIVPFVANVSQKLYVAQAQTRLYQLQGRVYEMLDLGKKTVLEPQPKDIHQELRDDVAWLSFYFRKGLIEGDLSSYFCTCRAIQLKLEKEMTKISKDFKKYIE